ncbi:MAG: cysteine hydrolase [Candidatus Verstraetearchaeota archaeon]|nr:cysteine hydrolase [Candidatus Verstraetearchaeota archaeon]
MSPLEFTVRRVNTKARNTSVKGLDYGGILALKALLVIDMLKGFIREQEKPIIPKIAKLIQAFREAKLPVIYICDSHLPGDKEFELWGPHALRGSPEAEVVDELKPAEGDYMVYKRRYTGFFATDLDLLLRELGVDEVVVCGIYTEYCVKHTVADAFFHNYKVTVVKDCISSYEEQFQEFMIDYMSKAYGAKIESLEKVISSLKI